jgi:uncharacterized protein YodC (DUF2158 family)
MEMFMADKPQPTGNASTFEVGDIVELKTGGIPMTAGELDPKKGRRCAWSVKDGIKEKFLPEGMLRPSQELRPPDIRIVPVGRIDVIYKTALEAIAAGSDDPHVIATSALQEAEDVPGEPLQRRPTKHE